VIGIHYRLETQDGEIKVFEDESLARSDAVGYIEKNVAVRVISGGGLVSMSCEYWNFVKKAWVHQGNAALFRWEHTRE
jgi:hypothetical protein